MSSRSRFAIRPGRLGDLRALMVMMRAFSGEDHVAWRPRRVLPALRRLLRAPRLGRVLVSAAGGELRGYAIGTFGYDLEFGGADAFVTEIFVRPAFRGSGEGRRLLEAITRAMRRGGAAAIHLAVRRANHKARRLYQTAGFAPIPRLVLSKRLGRSARGAA
ncbi:MAG TPA: GNAT family N-acetyltransferase [Polyangia bacterium]|nr:GNAT family N-acetyltransferase [Polyangia bacterium]